MNREKAIQAFERIATKVAEIICRKCKDNNYGRCRSEECQVKTDLKEIEDAIRKGERK